MGGEHTEQVPGHNAHRLDLCDEGWLDEAAVGHEPGRAEPFRSGAERVGEQPADDLSLVDPERPVVRDDAAARNGQEWGAMSLTMPTDERSGSPDSRTETAEANQSERATAPTNPSRECDAHIARRLDARGVRAAPAGATTPRKGRRQNHARPKTADPSSDTAKKTRDEQAQEGGRRVLTGDELDPREGVEPGGRGPSRGRARTRAVTTG